MSESYHHFYVSGVPKGKLHTARGQDGTSTNSGGLVNCPECRRIYAIKEWFRKGSPPSSQQEEWQ